MPEGHKVHRISRAFAADFVGKKIAARSPQGRFAAGAAVLDGRKMTDSRAVGKQMFLGFTGGHWLRVHLGIYGMWDFAGRIREQVEVDPRAGTRTLRTVHPEAARAGSGTFPPEPVGQVRLRLATAVAVADLRGPNTCELLTADEMDAVIHKLGPDPLSPLGSPEEAEQEFVRRVRGRNVAIGQLLMDQGVVSGIGNIYRAEMLFRAGLEPHLPGRSLSAETAAALWRDWVGLLQVGVDTGLMLTMDGLGPEESALALASRADRHWVYGRAGLPCRVCGTEIALETMAGRKLYWCPSCQR
ncbi:Fpg/Nei family DNA glycosylase [Nakamurella silvestris]|nr:Fpg/Nei family DNA glycosylase [Nakamurella silvestris]